MVFGSFVQDEINSLSTFLLRVFGLGAFMCSLSIILVSAKFGNEEYDTTYVWVDLINTFYASGICFACLYDLYNHGIRHRSISRAVHAIMIAFYINWITAPSAEIFHLTVLILDILVAVGRSKQARSTDGLCRFVLILFLIAVTVEIIDLQFEIGIHPWGREHKRSAFFLWMVYVAPVIGSYFLLKLHIEAVEGREEKILRSVEVAYHIANKLANFDLDGAEKLINNTIATGIAEDINEPLSRLLNHLRAYNAFLPEALFSMKPSEATDRHPNETLFQLMQGQESHSDRLEEAVGRLLDPGYSLPAFHTDMVAIFPELSLYLHGNESGGNDSPARIPTNVTTSGRLVTEEYERTLGALYSLYCMLRLPIDGKEILSFGIDETGCARTEPVGKDADKKNTFYETVPWNSLTDLLYRAELIELEENNRTTLSKERTISMLTLTAIHDIMKNKELLPVVDPAHAPFRGYASEEVIGDHDVALEYVLEHFPTALPSYKCLGPGQRAPILFSQSKMGFNNGWMVQAEAPPGALFSRFKKVIREGRASKADINFYFLHWFTDLAGAEPFNDQPWPGAEKFTAKFPVKVLSAFLESFTFVDRLATETEVKTMEDYLVSRYTKIGFSASTLPSQAEMAIMRLSLMAQGFESYVAPSFARLPDTLRMLLADELARTGCREQFRRAPSSMHIAPAGPAILIYYAPAFIQNAKADQCFEAMSLLAAIFRASRRLFPLSPARVEETITVRIDALKALTPEQVLAASPWHVRQTSSVDAEVAAGFPPDDVKTALIRDESCRPLVNLDAEKTCKPTRFMRENSWQQRISL